MHALNQDEELEATERARVLSEYITREDAERILGCAKSTIYELMRSGELPYSNVGARRYIRRRDLFHLIEQGFNAPSLVPSNGAER